MVTELGAKIRPCPQLLLSALTPSKSRFESRSLEAPVVAFFFAKEEKM